MTRVVEIQARPGDSRNASAPAPAGRARPVPLFWAILAIQALLCAAHVWFHLTWRGMHGTPDAVLVWTDMRWDLGLQSWLSWATMFLVGVSALRLARTRGDRERWGWRLIGTLFLYLALDDALTLHERVDQAMQWRMSGLKVYAWVVLLLPIFAVAGGFAFAFLGRVCRRDRRAWWQVLAGFGCLGVAVVIEACEMQLTRSGLRWRGFAVTEYTQFVEEFLELLGPALLLLVLGRVAAGGATPRDG